MGLITRDCFDII